MKNPAGGKSGRVLTMQSVPEKERERSLSTNSLMLPQEQSSHFTVYVTAPGYLGTNCLDVTRPQPDSDQTICFRWAPVEAGRLVKMLDGYLWLTCKRVKPTAAFS